MSNIRFVALLGALALSVAGCGGKSSANSGATTGGAGGASSSGGSNAGGASSFTCTEAGATELIGGVRFRCADGTWTPLSECMMGSDVTACCGGHSPMKSIDVATDPCLLPFPVVTDDGEGTCTKDSPLCVECGALDTPETRMAEVGADGQCIATSECQHSTDCVLAVNHLACCACPEPFPKTMLAREPCITDPEASHPDECGGCLRLCDECAAPLDPTPRCIANGSGIRACAFAPSGIDCTAQDAVGLYPDPPGGVCLPAMWTWNGTACVGFEGCLCSGTDCGALFESPEACLDQYRACGAVCVPGMDQTCNDDPVISSIAGQCEADGTCTCPPGRTYVQASGRCR